MNNENFENNNNFVFIIIRHVNSEITNNYWIESYRCIRNFYQDTKIIIIDDNSNYKYIKYNFELINTEIIQSEFPKCGELLPYYYFCKNKYAQKAVIIHDSIFIQKKVDFENIDCNVKFLWHHESHSWDNEINETYFINKLNYSNDIINFYNKKNSWYLCFGAMSFIDHDFLKKIENKYNFFNLLYHVKTRENRMCLERIFGLLCHIEDPKLIKDQSFFGNKNIWKYSFNNYLYDKQNNNLKEQFVKVFTGR